MLNHNDAAMVAAIRTLQESLTNEEYTVIMDEAVSLVESGITANNADAIKFIASKHLDEASYAIVEAVMDEAILNVDDAETAISARIKVANESTSIMGAIWGEPIDEALTSDEAARVQKRINKAHPTVSDPAWNKLTKLNSQRNIQPAHSQAAVGGFLSDKIKMQRAAAAHDAKPRYMGG